jgi:hypothetical protein
MLKINQLTGFGNSKIPLPLFATSKRVGGYPVTFSGGTTGTGTIPAADLGPATSNKQLLFMCYHETVVPFQIDLIGRLVTNFQNDNLGFGRCLVGFDQPGPGPLNFIMVTTVATSAQGWVEVYEFYDAVPLRKAFRNKLAAAGAGAFTTVMGQLQGDFGVGVVGALLDTTTFTWTAPFTERVDADAGTFRIGSADTGVLVGNSFLAATVTPSGADILATAEIIVPPIDRVGVKGGIYNDTPFTIASAQVNFNIQLPGAGTLLLGLVVEGGATVSSVNADGVAFTNRGSVVNTGATPDIQLSFWSFPFDDSVDVNELIGIVMSGAGADGTILTVSQWILYDVGSFGTAGSAQGNAAGAAVSVNPNANGMLVGIHCRADNTQVVGWTGAHEVYDNDIGGAYRFSSANLNYTAAGAQNVTASGVAGQYATLVLPINP